MIGASGPCTRERVMEGLKAALTELVQAGCGSQSVCTRNLNEEPSATVPEACPKLWIIEESDTVVGDNYETRRQKVTVLGLVRLSPSNAGQGLIQQQLNELQAVIEAGIYPRVEEGPPHNYAYPTFDVLGGVKVNIIHEPNERHELSAGNVEGRLWYPLTLDYARLA